MNKRKDGSTFFGELKVMPLINERGEMYGYLGIQRDVTERKKLEEERVHLEKLEAINNMVVTINHEMNQPLSVICSQAEFLLKDLERENPLYEDVKTIHEEAWKLADLVKKTREIRRIKTRDYARGTPMIDLDN